MTRMSERRRLPWSADDAAALVLDWSRDAEWRPAVTSMETDPPGPARSGQRIVERLRVAGLPVVVPLRIVEADATTASFDGRTAAMISRGRRSVVAEPDGGCTVHLELELLPRGPLALLGPLLAPGHRRMQRRDADALVAVAARPAVPSR